jgi:ACT domain-containing protein
MDLDKLIEELLEESKRTSLMRVTRQTKILKASGHLASTQARKRNDPLYKKMIYHRELYYKYRELVHKKYEARVKGFALR